jgi:hypothetical protein
MAIVDDELVAVPIAPIRKHDGTVHLLQVWIVMARNVMLVLDLLRIVLRPK